MISSKLSFLYESAATTETIGRYSFVGAGARHSDMTTKREDIILTPVFEQIRRKPSKPVLAMAPSAILFQC